MVSQRHKGLVLVQITTIDAGADLRSVPSIHGLLFDP
jgi:hypothetical protein